MNKQIFVSFSSFQRLLGQYLKIFKMRQIDYAHMMNLSRQTVNTMMHGRSKMTKAQYYATLYIFEHYHAYGFGEPDINYEIIVLPDYTEINIKEHEFEFEVTPSHKDRLKWVKM